MLDSKKSKIISLVLLGVIVVASILVFVIPPLLTEKFDEELIIYNWADYMDLTILDDFAEYYEEKTGKSLKITYTNFDTNETMLTEIIRGDSNIDLICPSEYAIEKLLRSGVLEKLDFSVVEQYDTLFVETNLNKDITDKIGTVFSAIPTPDGEVNMNDYFMPYMWGTLGILYNTNYITEEQIEEAGWGILWNETNIPEIEGKILVKDSIRDTYAATVLYLKETDKLPAGYENMNVEQLINCTDEALVDAAEVALKEQKKHLKGYEVDFGKDDMVNEIALVDLAWSGDAMYAIEEAMDDDGNSYLSYYVPEIGSNIWFDGWVMPENAHNKLAAYMFMNYLCRPDIAMYNTLEIGYSAAVDNSVYFTEDENDPNYEYALDAVAAWLECYEIETVEEYYDEFFLDERRYPEVTDNLGMMQDFGDRNESIVEMWERVKAHGEKGNWTLLIIIIAVIVACCGIAAGLIVWKFKKPPKARKVE